MSDLQLWQYALIALIFVWSGFVRSGLGFGGAVLSLPLLLLVDNRPLVYLPLISIHLLFFSSITVWQSHKAKQKAVAAGESDAESTVDWPFLKKALKIMIIPKMIGVLGLLTLPQSIMTGIIFCIVSVYAVSYIINKPFTSKNKVVDAAFLMLGGYVSGTSLIGAPLLVSVFASHVAKHRLRDTLFVLWFILVSIKLAAFIIAGVELHLIQHVWLLPAAAIGHVVGLRFHEKIINGDQAKFYRYLGILLLIISIFGVYNAFK